MIWDTGRVATLVVLKNRNWTMRQIAEELGTTKNTVVGKLYRLGLCIPKGDPLSIDELRMRRLTRDRKWRAKRNAGRPMKHLPPRIKIHVPECPAPLNNTGVTILERKPSQCAYPVGHRLFCGAPAVIYADGYGRAKQSSWCEYHFLICHRLPTKKKDAA